MTSFPPDRLYLIDTSAHARVANGGVRRRIAALLADGLAATCATVDLEAAYSGRDAAEVTRILAVRAEKYAVLPLTEAIADRARSVMRRMAQRGHHRAAGVFDLLTAATAEQYGATVLHYDADFEHIAETTGQPHVWIAPRGSLS